jgi:molecular chaperone GrpE (heat shock protein)
MSNVIESDFASTMQELSAQASAPAAKDESKTASGITALLSALHSLGQRFEALEETVGHELRPVHVEKIEQQLAEIRDNERVNQKLFDTLHQELISYRDNFVREALQKPFIRDLLVLFDDLSGIAAQFEQAASGKEGRRQDVQARDNLNNAVHFLLEILHRLEVNEIAPKDTIDRSLHRIIGFEAAESPEEDGQVVKRTKRGFTWHDRVLRHEEVIAKRFQ